MNLDEHQKEALKGLYKEISDLSELTRKVFNDEALDGRTKEGRAVRQYLIDNGFKYKTTEKVVLEEVKLTIEQKQYAREAAEEGQKVLDIARVIFPDCDIVSSLNREARTVFEYLRDECPDLAVEDEHTDKKYSAPNRLYGVFQKVNEYAGENINFRRMTTRERKYLESLLKFMRAPRLTQVVNSYSSVEDRKMLESEFVRFTWNKPDLTNEESALDISVCIDLVSSKRGQQHLEKLNLMIDEAHDDQDLHMRLSEMFKVKSDEYHKIMTRVDNVLKKLNGSRSDRIKMKHTQTSDFAWIVEAFQEKEERDRLVTINRAQALAVKDDTDRIESLEEWKARILGIDKDELI